MSGGPHFVLNGLAGWRAAALNGAALACGGNRLTLQALPGSARPLADGFAAAIGVALDSEDRVYVLDAASCQVKRFDPCGADFISLPCVGGVGSEPRKFRSPHGIAISGRDDLYVADTGNRRVQVFSLRGLPLRAIWVREGWAPWDIAVAGGKAYVSDYTQGLIHVFDSSGRWLTAYDGGGLVKPTRLAVDRQGRIYVVQEGVEFLVVVAADGKLLGKVSAPGDIRGRFCPSAVAIDVEGNLCLSDCVSHRIYFYRSNGDGGWCGYHCCGSTAAYASSLLFDRSGAPVFADGSRRVCRLEPPAQYPAQGRYYSEALDSRTYRCVWHRVVLRGSVPAGASVRVDTFTSEALKTTDEILSLPENRWSTAQRDTDTTACDWDCLLEAPPGRYLWLRLTLEGDGSETPVLEQVKVYYPRASSLQYLPAVYREGAVSGDFLDRFLSIFDTLRGRTSDQIGTMARYFDPKATPARSKPSQTDFLSWLASWLGMSLQNGWPAAKRRELVRRAHRLYALRGTPGGLALHIELYAGVRPQILELFKLRRWMLLNNSRLGDAAVFGDAVMQRLQVGANSRIGGFRLVDYGDPALDLFNAYAYQFLVVVPRWPGATAGDEQMLQQVIDMAKPAHTQGRLQWAEPRLRVGIQAFIGVDTVIGRSPVGVIEGQGKLGYDTVLGGPTEPDGPALRVGETSRVGCNTALK